MVKQSRLGAAILAAVLLGGGAAPVAAQKSADTLRITMRDALTNIDPYYNNLRTGVVMHHQAWDALVYRNPDTFKIEPLLATEWKLPDPTTIDFTLRPGVKFHDGSTLTADDVVYTLNLASDPASKVSTPANYNWIEKAEKTGELSVRVKLKRPTPAALEYFALVLPALISAPEIRLPRYDATVKSLEMASVPRPRRTRLQFLEGRCGKAHKCAGRALRRDQGRPLFLDDFSPSQPEYQALFE